MKPDQRWGDVWPAARTFHPAVVPLPVRQGVVQTKAQVVPSKYGNTELMKIPNFLHLTPPVIKEHCAAIAKFCTAWPAGLETEEETERHFPLTFTASDYLNSSSSIRDRRSRIVQLRVNINSLPLDDHARDKFIRLVGPRLVLIQYHQYSLELFLSRTQNSKWDINFFVSVITKRAERFFSPQTDVPTEVRTRITASSY